MDDSAIMCDKIIESHHNETNFNEKRGTSKMQNFCFTCIFINYYSIIDSCQYLLLFDKRSSKTKTVITMSLHKQQIKNIHKKCVIKSKFQV